MEKITTDIYSFENLRKDGFVYVDKTDHLTDYLPETAPRGLGGNKGRFLDRDVFAMGAIVKC